MFDQSMTAMHDMPASEKLAVNDKQARRGSIYEENEHFVTLSDPLTYASPVVIFFSFFDPRSKDWAVRHRIADTIRRNVPQGTSVSRYHTPMIFSWDFGESLTHSWAVANSLQVDDKVIGPLFDGIHSKRVHDLEGIRVIFDECGIPPDMFLNEWGKEWVIAEKEAMDNAVKHLGLKNVPGILVKGKYMVKLDFFGNDFNSDRAVDLVKNLLARE